MKNTELFQYPFRFGADVDEGMLRSSNQDVVICCPEYGFFAVSDGMGGLRCGGEASELLAKTLPERIQSAQAELAGDPDPEKAAELLAAQIRHISDDIFARLNQGDRPDYGATLCGVWLMGNHAVFVNLGDSRGYLLGFDEQTIRLITADHNLTAELIAYGLLSPAEARGHRSNSQLMRFVGMHSPASPDIFVEKVQPGDRILLCSDGLHGMVDDARLPGLLRCSKSPRRVVLRLLEEANKSGGRDNIAAVYVAISGRGCLERCDSRQVKMAKRDETDSQER